MFRPPDGQLQASASLPADLIPPSSGRTRRPTTAAHPVLREPFVRGRPAAQSLLTGQSVQAMMLKNIQMSEAACVREVKAMLFARSVHFPSWINLFKPPSDPRSILATTQSIPAIHDSNYMSTVPVTLAHTIIQARGVLAHQELSKDELSCRMNGKLT
ncbi:hypothetical protein CRM22_001151 [Opisthorchis felineus]|uniref:Uncharacterized protein n=1 Tax=Opisthorchis felineus TaxID=147828 RepID=A0A4S2MG46_OPIFE|nr:hypothetical protein CRM22_001151 [Opisthorchis felineus]